MQHLLLPGPFRSITRRVKYVWGMRSNPLCRLANVDSLINLLPYSSYYGFIPLEKYGGKNNQIRKWDFGPMSCNYLNLQVTIRQIQVVVTGSLTCISIRFSLYLPNCVLVWHPKVTTPPPPKRQPGSNIFFGLRHYQWVEMLSFHHLIIQNKCICFATT